MSASFELKVLSPSRTLTVAKAVAVTLPGSTGYLTILPDHMSMVADLGIGSIVVSRSDNKVDRFFVSGGYLEVDAGKVTVLGDIVEKEQEIDSTRAKSSLERAIDRLKGPNEDTNLDRAQLSLKRAQERLIMAETLASVAKL